MRFTSGLSLAPARLDDVAAVARRVRRELGAAPTLATVFATAEFASDAVALSQVLQHELAPAALVGCTAQGVVAGRHEIEHAPAVSIWAGHAPGLHVRTRHFVGSSDAGPVDGDVMLLLADPFTFPAVGFLQELGATDPRVACLGGLASGGTEPGENVLFCDSALHREGAVAAVLRGPVRVRTVVSQGCRPIGAPFLVTAAEGHTIVELGGRPALDRLTQAVAALPEEDRELAARGIQIGRVVDEHKASFDRGDFLIRNVLAADGETGTIEIGDAVEVGSTVQFHVRDSASAAEDLDELLSDPDLAAPGPAGALLFTCNGRGRRFFGTPDHDAAAVVGAFGDIGVAGFFCAGEIGPVGGANHVHGFTASIGLFGEVAASGGRR